jgi:phospholipid transport system substrate-binding protein
MKIRRCFIFILPTLIFFASLTFSSSPARSASFEEEATIFVQDLAQKAVLELTDKSAPREQRIQRFREYFNKHFAVRGIGKWILGRHWRKAKQPQQEEYLMLFEDLMVVSYVDRFAAYAGEPLRIQKALVQDEKNITVFSNFPQQEGNPAIRIDWRVARKEGMYKIVDVVVEGTSMSNTLRSDFGSIIRQRGGKVAGLLEALREKTAKLRQKGKD